MKAIDGMTVEQFYQLLLADNKRAQAIERMKKQEQKPNVKTAKRK